MLATSLISRELEAEELTVIAMATPMKSIYVLKLMCKMPSSSENWWYTPHARAQPRPNGRARPANATEVAMRQLLIRKRTSVSSPIRKR